MIFQIYNKDSSKTELFKIASKGGEPEPYNFYDGTALGESASGGLSGMSISSDGKWTLYTNSNYTITIADSVSQYDDNGNYTGYYSFYGNAVRQCVYNNNETGDNYYLLPPNPYFETQSGKFSPDNKKYAYLLSDHYAHDKGIRIFIKDFDVSKLQKITIFTAVKNNGPEAFETINNYPNPFNPTTTIEFNLTKPGYANLSVYNLTGQKVCELASGDLGIGKHSYLWNGRDSKGTPVSSGIFFTRLETRDNVISNRMMLVK